MNEPYLPNDPAQKRRQGMGCFAKGCLISLVVVMLAGVLIGGFAWFVFNGSRDYFTQQPVSIHVYPATDEQYNAVLAKLQPFGQALQDGHAATLRLSADELNTLIARVPTDGGADGAAYVSVLHSPTLAAAVGNLVKMRGHVYVNFVNNQVVSEISTPLSDNPRGNNTLYFNGRVTMDASYSADEFNFVLRSVAPLKGQPTGFMSQFSNSPNFLRVFSRAFTDSFNTGFNDAMTKNSGGMASKERIRTIVLQDNQIVFTAADALPDPSASPAVVAPDDKTP